ncbi:MAG: cytochrome c3 family protein [Armatimonadetes bacterium]|nr:cytochrome c3 family protein [Armatimonadota bacterium]
MKKRLLLSLLASIPVVAAILALQSCGGVGGPTTDNGGQGSVSADFLALLSDEQKAASSITPEECADCHGGRGPDDPIYAHWKDTKHYSKGVTCESCHGPGSAHKANPTETNILAFPKITDPKVCAQCHGPIADQYNFSGHAKLIADPVEEAIVNPATYGRSSRCIACHSGLVRAEYVEGGKDLGTATDDEIRAIAEETINEVPHSADCVSCHSPHKATGNLTQNGEEAQLRKKVFNTDTTDIAPGKTAAVFTNYNHTCAQCHNGRGTDPSDAKLTSGTARPSMHDSNQMQMLMGFGGVEGTGAVQQNTAHAQAPGQCTKCHMPDSRHTFTVSFDTGCSPCHTAADAAARATSIKSEVLNRLVEVRTRMEAWAKAKFGNDLFWEYTSNITAEGFTAPAQTGVPIEIKRARHNYYFVIRSGDYGVHNAPYAKYLLDVCDENLDKLSVARAAASRLSTQGKLDLIKSDLARARKADLTAND